MYLFLSSLFSAIAHKASVSFSKGGREGVLEHDCGLWTRGAALGLLGGAGSESGFLYYLPPWLKVQGTRTSNCSWWPQFCPWWVVVEAAASGLSEHILLLLASPLGELFFTPAICKLTSYCLKSMFYSFCTKLQMHGLKSRSY